MQRACLYFKFMLHESDRVGIQIIFKPEDLLSLRKKIPGRVQTNQFQVF